MELRCRNVNDAFTRVVEIFHDAVPGEGVIERRTYSNPNGSGTVDMIPEPVLIHYTHPLERVLFNSGRDANPFFHLYESLWMLAGRRDVKSLEYYNSKAGFCSDNGTTFNGAYGWRWRGNKYYQLPQETRTIDQLKILIQHLKATPGSRRAVLSMWNVEDDLLKVDNSRDVVCNLNILFSLRERLPTKVHDYEDYNNTPYALDMTVTNRSNDLVWGMLGANYVHFTILQEYMAAHLGVEVGRYCHFTNNLHVYDYNFHPDRWDVGNSTDLYCGRNPPRPFPLVKDPQVFDEEIQRFVDQYGGKEPMEDPLYEYKEPFLQKVAAPMMTAYLSHKKKTATIMEWCSRIEAEDWRVVATQWIERRRK